MTLRLLALLSLLLLSGSATGLSDRNEPSGKGRMDSLDFEPQRENRADLDRIPTGAIDPSRVRPTAITEISESSGDTGPSRGELLGAACNACHGPDGRGSGSVPALREPCGPSRLTARLEAWRAQPDADDPAHLMVRVARGLDSDDIAALATWYRPERAISCD